MNSKRKGAEGAREAAEFIRDVWGLPCRRGQQYRGSIDSPDVVSGFDGVHIEVKRVERLDLCAAMRQATEDAGGMLPLVLHRRNKSEWLVTFPANRVEEFVRLWDEAQRKHHTGGDPNVN